jgi:phage replication O-like protein O
MGSKEHFTGIPNDVLEAMAIIALPPAHMSVLLHIARRTFGWHLGNRKFNYTEIAKAVNLNLSQVSRAIRALEARCIIADAGKKQLGICKDIGTWVYTQSQELPKRASPEAKPKKVAKTSKSELPKTASSGDHTFIKESIKEILSCVFGHWNLCNIVKHKTLTELMRNAIKLKLKEYTRDEIMQTMTNYAVIVHGDEYGKWSYKWTLYDFLTRKGAFDKFIDLDVAKNNYKGGFGNGKSEPKLPARSQYTQFTD